MTEISATSRPRIAHLRKQKEAGRKKVYVGKENEARERDSQERAGGSVKVRVLSRGRRKR